MSNYPCCNSYCDTCSETLCKCTCELLTLDLLRPHQVYRNRLDERLPSVTAISGLMKPDLGRWHNRQGLDGVDTSISVPRLADIGTITHARIEARLTQRKLDESNLDPVMAAQSRYGYRRFMDWWVEQELSPYANELRLVSEKLQVGGTLDIIARRTNGTLILIDIKATNGIHREHKIQVAGGYAPIFHEVKGIYFAEVWIVRVGREKDDTLEAVHVNDRAAYERAFRSLRAAYADLERLPKEE